MNEKRIIYAAVGGGVAVVIPAPDCGLTIDQIAAKDVPQGVAFDVVATAALPADRLFRNAWEKVGAAVVESLPKSRMIAHEARRARRAQEFAPLDVEATIPVKAAQAEAARQAIRDRHAAKQVEIDAAPDVAALRGIVVALLAESAALNA